MGLDSAFEVATEFRFDVGEAILNTKTLQGAVEDLSNSASSAIGSLSYLASGLVAHLGYGSGGLLTVLTRAVGLSQEFQAGSMGFINTIGTNMRLLDGTIYNFNDQLGTSNMLMTSITKTANDLGISAPQLAQMTQTYAGPLAARGKLGDNFANAISLAKNSSIVGEATGLGPTMIQESVLRALNPGQGFGGKLFERLLNTNAFREAHITRSGQGANLNVDKKIDLVTRALGELGNNADYLTARTQNLGVLFRMLKGQIDDILKPIGDAISEPLKKIMFGVVNYLKANGADFGKQISQIISGFISDPKSLFVNLMQMRALKSDFRKALDLSSIIVPLIWLKGLLEKVGIVFNGGLITRIASGIMDLFIMVIPQIGYWLGVAARFITPAIGEFITVFAPLLFFFQILSRAKAIGEFNSIQKAVELFSKLAAVGIRLKSALENVLLPLNMIIDFWANLLAPLFETTFWLSIAVPILNAFAAVLEFVGTTVLMATNAFAAFNYMMIGFIDDIVHLRNPMTNALSNLKTGFDDFYQAHNPSSSPATKYQVTNNNHIEARFDMREQMEPDRIAFAVTTHLKKLAINPTQGRGESLGGGFLAPFGGSK